MTRSEAAALVILVLMILALATMGRSEELVLPSQVPPSVMAAQGEADPHEGQPDHCANAKDAPKAHKCDCKKEPGIDGAGCDVEDRKCKVYCRPNHCHCVHPACDS